MPKSSYNFFFDNGDLVLIDECGKDDMSLTNNMENVLRDISKILSIKLSGKIIVYRDTRGTFDQVMLSDNGTVSFKSLNCVSYKGALIKARKNGKLTRN